MSNRDEAIKLAIEAGMTCYGAKSEKLGHSWHSYTDNIERFARLVAEKEREECARVCEVHAPKGLQHGLSYAAAIRARKP